MSDTPEPAYLVIVDDTEEPCETPEEVSRLVTQYQMQHPEDPDFTRLSVIPLRAGEPGGRGERVPVQRFLPQQIP